MSKAAKVFPDIASVVRDLRPSYPVYCVRPEVITRNAKRFLTGFPGQVLYAVKCNPHPMVLDALYAGGIRHFDTASLAEIAQICESYEDAHAYFMHPVKTRAAIEMAYTAYGIRHYVVDHEAELQKVFEETRGDDDVVVVVRFTTPKAEGTMFHLAGKFGAEVEQGAELLKQVAAKGMQAAIPPPWSLSVRQSSCPVLSLSALTLGVDSPLATRIWSRRRSTNISRPCARG